MKLGLCLIQVAGCGMYRDIITALPVSWRLYSIAIIRTYVHAQVFSMAEFCCLFPQDTEIDFDHVANVHGDRLTLYCVPIPAETQWTKAIS